MKAAVFRRGEIVVDTLPDPKPGKGQVLARTLACGICGSDLHALRHSERLVESWSRAGVPIMDLGRDIVFGHEFCAEIVDYGPDTEKRLAVGTRVCALPLAVTDQGPATVGYANDYPGGYGELMVLEQPFLVEVPAETPTKVAALTEPMAVGAHAVEQAEMRQGEIPLVVGCGPVGLAVIASLKRKGISPIVAADFSVKRRELAAAMGADVTVDPAERSPYESWQQTALPPGFDPTKLGRDMLLAMLSLDSPPRPGVIFECVGVPGVIQQLMEGALPRTRIVVVGVCMEEDRFEPMLGINRQVDLRFVLGYTLSEYASTLAHLSDGSLLGEPMITGTVGVDEVAGAFEDLASPETHAKILVEPWR